MNGCFILQSDYSQDAPLKIVHHTPESKTIVFLRLYLERVFDDFDAPFFLEIRPFPQYFIFEIFGELVNIHDVILHLFFALVHSRKNLPENNDMELLEYI
jgi:hypothetical protein